MNRIFIAGFVAGILGLAIPAKADPGTIQIIGVWQRNTCPTNEHTVYYRTNESGGPWYAVITPLTSDTNGKYAERLMDKMEIAFLNHQRIHTIYTSGTQCGWPIVTGVILGDPGF